MALKPVEIAIRAKDQTKPGVQQATTALERFAAAQARTQNRRQAFGTMKADAMALATAYREAADRANELGQRIGNAKRPSKALRDEFAAVRAEAKRLKTEAIEAAAAVGRIGGQVGQRGSFETFDRVATSANRAKVAIGAETAALNTNTAALGRNANASKRRGDLADRITGAAATRNQRGPLGLRPYELQNLSYQINDFFTQIASGTSASQAFAQQFGQVAQLFPRVLAGFVRFIPVIGLVTLALAPFVAKLLEVNNQAKNLKTFEQLLGRSGEAANYQAQQLAWAAERLDDYGASADGAREAVSRFVQDAVRPEYLDRFGRTSQDLAKVLGIDLADASEKVSTAFTGNLDAVLALDDELNFMTDSERKLLEQMKKTGKEAEGRVYAFGILERKYGDVASKMEGPWTRILKNFNGAWESFVDFVNFADFSAIKTELSGLMRMIERLTASLPGARERSVANIDQRIAELEGQVANNNEVFARQRQRVRDGNVVGFALGLPEQLDPRRFQAMNAEAELFRLRNQRDLLAGMTANNGNLLPEAPATDTTFDPQAPSDRGGGRRGESEAEKAAKRRAELLADLNAANAARAFEGSLVNRTARESQILSEIEATRLKFAEEGLVLSAEQQQSIRESVGALYDEQQEKRAQQTIDAALLELAEARGEVEEESAYVARKAREAGFEVLERLDAATGEYVVGLTEEEEAYRRILREIYRINDATRQRQAADKGVTDLSGMRSELMEQIEFYENAGQQGTADRLREQLVGVNEELRKAVDDAIALNQTLGGEGSEAAILRLQLLKDQLAGIGENALFSGKMLNDMIAGGVTDAFDQFAQAVAEGANVIDSLKNAFLQFAADFLREIAKMIIQQAVLNALQATTGGGGGVGGGIAGVLNGVFGRSSAPTAGGGGLVQSEQSVNGILGFFRNLPRFHTGGIIGMAPDERLVVSQVGEEMITTSDPRHRNNGGGQQGLNVKNVNVFDPADILEASLATERGQRIVINFMTKNARGVSGAIAT